MRPPTPHSLVVSVVPGSFRKENQSDKQMRSMLSGKFPSKEKAAYQIKEHREMLGDLSVGGN